MEPEFLERIDVHLSRIDAHMQRGNELVEAIREEVRLTREEVRLSREERERSRRDAADHARLYSDTPDSELRNNAGMRRLVLVVAACSLVAGCGGGSDEQPSPSGGEETSKRAIRDAVALLDSWNRQLLPVSLLVVQRGQATDAGDAERATELEDQIARELETVEDFSPDARKELADDPDSELTNAVIEAGDAWTEWAHTLRTQPPAGDVEQAQRIADLASDATRLHRQAYEVAGEPVPPGFLQE